MHVLTLKTNLRMPFMREYLLLHGLSDVSRETCIKILNRSILNTSCAEDIAVCPLLQSEQQFMVHTAIHLCTPHRFFGDDSICICMVYTVIACAACLLSFSLRCLPHEWASQGDYIQDHIVCI